MMTRGMCRGSAVVGFAALLSVFILASPTSSSVAQAQSAQGGAGMGYAATQLAELAEITITRAGGEVGSEFEPSPVVIEIAASDVADDIPARQKQAALVAVASEPVVVAEGNSVADVQLADAQVAQAIEDVNDPLEPVNRVIFYLNDFLIEMFLKPLTEIYDLVFPAVVKDGVGNVLDNLRAPVILVNDLLQGEGERAWQTTQRFFINSTIGVAGIFDVAESQMGIPEHSEDFGQTLAVWGTGEMFYLVIPLFGPSSPRDAVGKLVVDSFFDPFNIWWENADYDELIIARAGLGAIDSYNGVREELDQIKKTSVDYYAAVRSMYRQKRESEIRNGDDVDLPPIPDLSYEFDEEDIKAGLDAPSVSEPAASTVGVSEPGADGALEIIEVSQLPTLPQPAKAGEAAMIAAAPQVAAIPEAIPVASPARPVPQSTGRLTELFPMAIVAAE